MSQQWAYASNFATGTATGNASFNFHVRVPPPPDDGLAGCYAVLGVPPGAPPDAVRKAYRAKLKETHPDHGGTADDVRRVVEAYRKVAA